MPYDSTYALVNKSMNINRLMIFKIDLLLF